jgi:hypothetical protein
MAFAVNDLQCFQVWSDIWVFEPFRAVVNVLVIEG